MTSPEWERVKDLVATALECDLETRELYLCQLEREDPSIAAQVAELIRSHNNSGDFLDRPLILDCDFLDDLESDQRFSPGELVSGRFEIARLIGKGGMGEVYEAWDRELEDQVALKTLRFEVSTHEVFTARFRKEIQLARKVTHPNVCRIFDSFRHQLGDTSYISVLSMELLHGQTLAEYLSAKGRLTVAEAWPIVQQIIDGLQAVHEAGIIHRDLKPSNLVLVPDGDSFRVKITDFGIAGRLPDDPSQAPPTQASKMLGTPGYMAPEQLELGLATVRSDIYALGLMLYEMVTGTKPFAGDAVWKRLHEDPRPPKKVSPSLPDNWNKVILCCLERKPEYRFPDVETVGRSLSGETATVHLPHKPLATRIRAWTKYRRAVIGSILAAVALLLFTLRFYQVKPKLQEGATVVFPEIENTTSDQELEGVTDLMRNQLEQSPNFMLLERSQMRSIVQQMGKQVDSRVLSKTEHDTAREMAWRAGAGLILFTTLSRGPRGYLLTVRAEEVPAKPDQKWRQWEESFAATNKDKIFDATQQACRWFRNLVEKNPVSTTGREPLPQSTTTSSWNALLLFSQAERLKAAGQTLEAIPLLKKSTEIDPDFALAYMRLGDFYMSLKDEKNGLWNWQRAVDTLKRRQVTQQEEVRIRALFDQDSGDWAASQDALNRFELLYPRDYLPSFYLATTLAKLNLTEQALAKSQQAAGKQPQAYAPVAQEARLEMVLNKTTDAARAIERLRAMGRQDSADSIEAGLGFLTEDFASTVGALYRLQQSSDPLSRSKEFSLRAAFLAEMRRFPEARRVLKDGASFDDANSFPFFSADKWTAISYLHLRTGNRASCRRAAWIAIGKEDGPLHLLQAGTLLARAGFSGDAGQVLHRLDSWPSLHSVQQGRHQILGEILLNEGIDEKKMLKEMQTAADLDAPSGSHEYLARAWVKLGESQKALDLYKLWADSPGQIWQAPDYEYPGTWADMAEKYVELQSDHNDPVARRVEERMIAIDKAKVWIH